MDTGTGKVIIFIGLIIVIIGLIIYFFNDKLGWIGHLPGDIRIERENFRFYFPFTTLVLLNLLLFLLMKIWRWLN
ncbi:DUF2905 domain-containing protein [Mucilaginibacter sp. RS28]|uniref:DUF2905 domain-containing protein n=1 Tax=Mucilaginibacter straminoryzae TaxID=2932774 RepID=A0A9X1X688_9SPHI|nr:DUF2905 domain-containing protein [Mucilaginibacter straminoryzae]MCJ8211736.1 DUF2905 domain-containing protein [Mucilaginibacter straminoryzae]